MTLENINIALGGTSSSTLPEIKTAYGLQNHELISIDGSGNIANLEGDNININEVTIDTANVTNLSGGTHKIHNIITVSDSTTYTTTNTSNYGASGSFFGSYTPTTATSSLYITGTFYVEGDGYGSSIIAALHWFDGLSYIYPTDVTTMLLQGTVDFTRLRGCMRCGYSFGPNMRRDNGDWTIRTLYSIYNGGSSASMFRGRFVAIEYEEDITN